MNYIPIVPCFIPFCKLACKGYVSQCPYTQEELRIAINNYERDK